MRLQRLSRISMAGCIVGLLLLGGLAGRELQRTRTLQQEVGELLRLQARINQFNAASDGLWLLRAEPGLWQAFRRDARELRGRLQRLNIDQAEADRAAHRIERLVETLADARAAGVGTSDKSVDETTRILLNHLSVQGIALDSTLEGALQQRRAAIAGQASGAAFTFTAAALLFGLLCLATFGLIHRRIGRPVNELLTTVAGLRAGDDDIRAAVPARDELGDLGRAINQLADERRAADARIREQQETLIHRERMLAESQRIARIGSWHLDAATFRLDWSDETYRLVGVSPDDFTPSPEAFLEHVHPDDRQQLLDVRDPALAGERTHDATFRIRRPDGEERIVHEIATTERDAAGGIVALTGTIQDVTEERLARRHNEQYRRLLEASQDLFCIIDGAERYVMMTDAYAHMYGLDRDRAEGADLRELFDPGFIEREVVPPLQRCLAGNDQRFEAERELPGAGRRHLLIHYFPVPGTEAGECLAGVSITDITAFRRAEDELREQARLLEIAGRIARLGGFRIDLAERRVTWSDVVAEIHGKPRGYAPTVDEALAFFEPAHRERVEAAFNACAAHGTPYEEDLELLPAGGGDRRWTRAVGQPVYDDAGRIIAIEGAFQDIDADKRREERLNDYRALIEHSSELFAIGDDGYRYTLVNRAYARTHGVEPDDVAGRPIRDLVGEREFEERVRPHYDRALAGERVQYETVREDPERGPRHILLRYYPIDSIAGAGRHAGAVMTDITELKQAESELRERGRLLEMAGRVARFGAWSLDLAADRVTLSDVAADIHELPRGTELTVAETMARYAPEHREALRADLERGEAVTREVQLVTETGKRVWVQVAGEPVHDEHGRIIGARGAFQDVTERHRILEQLREQEESLRQSRDQLAGLLETRQTLINALPAHIALLDKQGTIVDVNEQWRHFGRDNGHADADAGLGRNYLEICDAATGDCAEGAQEARDGLRAILDGAREQFVLEYPCHSPERERWFRLMANHIDAPGSEVGAVVMHLDITQRKIAERRLNRLAYEDGLTGLPSRNGIVQALREGLESSGWQPGAVLVMLDIDGQRDINDVYGFAAGDRLLIAVGQRLVAELGSGAVVGRTGGDEFTVFLPEAGDTAEPPGPAEVRALFERPFRIDEASVDISARFGFTRLGESARAVEELLREAEMALFRTREDHDAGPWIEYTRALDEASHHRIALTRELRRALERHEFELHFQPKVDLTTGHMVSGEALIRWQHPARGLLSPAAFIPVAEQSQLIGPIGDWALREACRLLAEWRNAGLEIVRVAVNVSVVQFSVGDFAATVADALDVHGVEPSDLTLEITESVFERESQQLRDQLRRLHELGVRLSLDDFGTGYSSLLYLQRYPFDEIKIDQGFVRNMLHDDYSARIVTTVISIANGIGAELVAEGIEERELAAALVAMGCRVGQGYYYSMPLAEEDFRWLLEQRTALPTSAGG